ncbi:hydrogenase formation protein HypD [Sporomusaceae bacterium FL31]|nr:hydrogenase formation protein HypD [Sporomusaceae bacterium FL31]GCE33207.1 hydrogenase formation protein HypD [Sporomusaceae bacterium]
MAVYPNDHIQKAAAFFTKEIDRLSKRPVRLMEVCGTHTVAIFKAGIRNLLPEQVELVSGPGCPVCVTPSSYLDTAIAYSRQKGVIITTFGDMLRVPGAKSTLSEQRAAGADIRIVYSPLECIDIAKNNPMKKVVFLAVGFETTAPVAAATIIAAENASVKNFFVLSAHKRVPPALKMLLANGDVNVDGFLLPGHVCAITGESPYHFLAEQYHIPAVVTGFSAIDILQAIYTLVKQIETGEALVGNQYKQVVKPEGNPHASRILDQVYGKADAVWRGLGKIANSGLELRSNYTSFDITNDMPIDVPNQPEHSACRCGEVLRGKITPRECLLFGKTCTPEQPVGACMVSVEGTCAAWHRYGTWRWQG